MKTFFKTSLFLIMLSLGSCNMGVKGNGIIKKENRKVTAKFTQIKTSNGLNILLTEAKKPRIRVEADENLLDLIKTEIKDNTLHIFTTENIAYAKARDVYVDVSFLSGLTASSGSNVSASNTFTADEITVKASSGAAIALRLAAKTVLSEASSGANVTLSGKTKEYTTKASSGSSITASSLQATIVTAKASSGASISVNSTNTLTAKASSGASISYSGNPTEKNIKKSSGGSVSKK